MVYKDKLKGNPKQGLWGATLGFFVGFAAVALFGPTAAAFKEALNLDPFLLGLLIAMPSLSGSLLRIPFAAWVSTHGGRRPFLVLLTLSIIGMAGLFGIIHFYYPDNLTFSMYPVLLFFALLSGCGIATFSVGIAQVSYWFDKPHEGRALGTYAGVGNLAPGIFSFLLPVALISVGLGGSYLLWLLFLTTGTIIYYFVAKDAWYFQLVNKGYSHKKARSIAKKDGEEFFPAENIKESLRESARIWKTWILVIIYFTTFGGFIALTAWLPTYWNSFFGFTLLTAGLLTALYAILASLLRIVGGVASDKFGGYKTIIFSLLVMLVGALLFSTSKSFEISIFAEILMALGMGFGNAAVFKLVPQEIPKAIGGASGWIGGLGALGGFVIPPILGIFVGLYGIAGYATGFGVFVVLSIISLASMLFLKSHRS